MPRRPVGVGITAPIRTEATGPLKRNDFRLISQFRFSLLPRHDLFRKPVSTFRDHALGHFDNQTVAQRDAAIHLRRDVEVMRRDDGGET
jgi:hypothetical protein